MNFSDRQTWENYDKDKQVTRRAEVIRELIPSDTGNILDAGCGSGIVTHLLCQDFPVTAIDISETALEYLQCPHQVASVTSIPYPDASFDLVNSNEVLEHLSDNDLNSAIAEFKRCAKRYILISVPHQEQLQRLLVLCANCKMLQHPYGHLQSFTLQRMEQLLEPEFYLKRYLVFGRSQRDYNPLLLNFRQRILGQWFTPDEAYRCVSCGSAEFKTRQNLLTKVVNGINLLTMRQRPYWMFTLFVRKESKV